MCRNGSSQEESVDEDDDEESFNNWVKAVQKIKDEATDR